MITERVLLTPNLVDRLTRLGVNKTLSVIITYLLAVGFLALLLFSGIPPLIEQIREFITNLPIYVNWLVNNLNSSSVPGVTTENITNVLTSKIDTALSNLLNVAKNVFGVFVSFISVAVFTFYLLLERDRLKKNLFVLFPNLSRQKVTFLAHTIEEKLGAWVRGE